MRRNKEGWSLVELAIVVTIIGILAALAIPLFKMIMVRSQLSTLANDLRTHGEAFHRYAMENGDYPPSSGSGSIPVVLKGYLSPMWTEPSPIGGAYSWVRVDTASGTDAYIQIVSTGANPFALSYSDLLKLDEKIDDGSAGSGFLRVSGRRVRYFISKS